MFDEKLPVIYILSNGRSGSTLLDLLLGAHPEIWTLGEAQMLPWEVRWRGPCGCGKPHADCDFWRDLLPELPLGDQPTPIEHFRAVRGGGKVLRPAQLPDLLLGRTSGTLADAARQYGEVNYDYFRRVLQAAKARKPGVRVLVDASKDPYRLHWLHRSGLFAIKVIHLFKDPRAFVYSMARRELPHAPRRAARFTLRWLVENGLFAYMGLREFRDGEMMHLAYERLASDPERILQDIGHFLGMAMPEGLSRTFREAETHGVSGNKMRWENTAVRLDEKWKDKLLPAYIQAIGAATWPLAQVLRHLETRT